MEMVIYKELENFKATNKKNYTNRIRNSREILDFSSFENAKDIKEYLIKYGNIKEENIIVL